MLIIKLQWSLPFLNLHSTTTHDVRKFDEPSIIIHVILTLDLSCRNACLEKQEEFIKAHIESNTSSISAYLMTSKIFPHLLPMPMNWSTISKQYWFVTFIYAILSSFNQESMLVILLYLCITEIRPELTMVYLSLPSEKLYE